MGAERERLFIRKTQERGGERNSLERER